MAGLVAFPRRGLFAGNRGSVELPLVAGVAPLGESILHDYITPPSVMLVSMFSVIRSYASSSSLFPTVGSLHSEV